jgi:hypothetical protein
MVKKRTQRGGGDPVKDCEDVKKNERRNVEKKIEVNAADRTERIKNGSLTVDKAAEDAANEKMIYERFGKECIDLTEHYERYSFPNLKNRQEKIIASLSDTLKKLRRVLSDDSLPENISYKPKFSKDEYKLKEEKFEEKLKKEKIYMETLVKIGDNISSIKTKI